jgi:hypothetical protein
MFDSASIDYGSCTTGSAARPDPTRRITAPTSSP